MKKELFILCLALLVGCSKEQPEALVPGHEEETIPFELSFATKTGDSGNYTDTTYRAQLFYRGVTVGKFIRFDSLMTPYSGTYCKPKGSNTWLTPCSVDADFNFLAEGSQYGLRAGAFHSYYLFLSSPATAYVHYADTIKINPDTGDGETMEYWGLPYKREGAPKDHPSLSSNAKVEIKGLTTNAKYKYSLDDTMKLVEYRSRMAISVRCGEAIDHVNLKSLRFVGLRKEAVLKPFTKSFWFNNIPANLEDVVVYESTSASGLRLERTEVSSGVFAPGESQSLTGLHSNQHLDDPKMNTHFTYILSDDYKALDASNKYLNQPAEVAITVLSDDGAPISLDPIKFDFIFEPQKSYFYLISINSVNIAITVYSKDWSDPVVSSTSIEEPEYETLTISIKDWTVKSNSFSIDSTGGGSTTVNNSTSSLTTSDWNTYNTGNSVVD